MPESEFPAIHRRPLEILQVNLGARCNQRCAHCHVDAGPQRTEEMSAETVEEVLTFLRRSEVSTLDITGGAPELNPSFRRLVREARALDLRILDRCNLTILVLPEQRDLARFLADHRVEVVASLPCYLEENVDRQRGKGTFRRSLEGLRALNRLGYGREGSGLVLDLVYNPQGPKLPPPQESLEAEYRRVLGGEHGIVFNRVLTLTNMPIHRFREALAERGELDGYMTLLRESHHPGNLESVMCRNLLSVDWRGFVFDCDFNQMLGMPVPGGGLRLAELSAGDLDGRPIATDSHCYGCTAGQGSSCGGALE
ncbi:MAG: arsenosugar biosynthesis radical SAM protein ArsS [Acidobacteriota bacterium]|jgi:radical SAM/Cys-rich protein